MPARRVGLYVQPELFPFEPHRHPMRWLFTLQQRLALTDRETRALALVAALLAAGLLARYADARWSPPPPPPRALLSAVPPAHTVPAADTLASARASRIPPAPADSPGAKQPLPASTDSSSAPPSPDPPSTAAADGPRMNLNTASAALLQRLPGIGPRLAERIVTYRTAHGPFRSVDDLQRVKGIGAKTLDRLRPLLFVP